MAYVGTPIDTTNQFQSLQGKRFSGNASTTAFTLDVAPGSTLDIEVYVENVRQDPNSAYSLSGTTLTFAAAPPSGTNNIYVIHQAKAVGTINPTNDSVTASSIADDAVESEHLNDNIISGQTALTAEPADTDEFLVSDAGTLKRIDYSLIKGGGKIGQVVQDTKTDTFSTSSGANSPAAITGLSVAITPSATSSKILVMVNIGFVSQSGANHGSFFLQRGGSNIFVGDAASNRPRATFGYGDHYNDWVGSPVSCCYLDSPSSTSEQTYSVAVGGNGSATMYINRSHRDNDGTAEDGRQASTITVMEVLA